MTGAAKSSWLGEVFKEAANRDELRKLKNELRADEVEIAIQYLRNLIASRPKGHYGAAKDEAITYRTVGR